ncbi:uncharacterized protein EI90DRAFT_2712494 [Cantharellus anzutake]|uniref:uncharacterized protein n=1 Tax=Cantharellus anzutake TaxID=1750568 RepID=UPI00190717D3|nr:uncharacterized protein EI90DRAFT_2712494 [Cantharellus anzutake]KAF8318352.1 hypothetical protein EI90DRAFT_2712494 [Cantharellus anzutake]
MGPLQSDGCATAEHDSLSLAVLTSLPVRFSLRPCSRNSSRRLSSRPMITALIFMQPGRVCFGELLVDQFYWLSSLHILLSLYDHLGCPWTPMTRCTPYRFDALCRFHRQRRMDNKAEVQEPIHALFPFLSDGCTVRKNDPPSFPLQHVVSVTWSRRMLLPRAVSLQALSLPAFRSQPLPLEYPVAKFLYVYFVLDLSLLG